MYIGCDLLSDRSQMADWWLLVLYTVGELGVICGSTECVCRCFDLDFDTVDLDVELLSAELCTVEGRVADIA